MELGANRKSLARLAGALGALALVTYFQFLRGPGDPVETRPPQERAQAPSTASPNREGARREASASRAGGRFQPRLGRSRRDDPPDPMSADAKLRKDLLERVRGIKAPTIERDIFNFGRPRKPEVQPPTPEETRLAQERLAAAMARRKQAAKAPPARKAPPRAPPPQWKYYGLASLPGSESRQAFLLDGEEILVATEGALVRQRYRIGRIDEEAIALFDTQSDQEFSIALEAVR